MSEADQIKSIIQELNAKKADVVSNAKKCVDESMGVATDKITDKNYKSDVETILTVAARGTHSTTVTIPDILINGGSGPVLLNTVTIVSPVGARSPYKITPIPVQFKVSGPHHTSLKDYVYIILMTDRTGKRVFNERGMAKDVVINHANPLNLPDGQYKIQIITADPITKNILAQSREETFVVDIGGGAGPVNIVSNIYINNYLVNIGGIIFNVVPPFAIPLHIKFELSNPKFITYFTHPLTIMIRITEDGTGRMIYSAQDTFMGIEYILKEHGRPVEIPFQKEGKYNILIIVSNNTKDIYKRVVPVTVKKKNTAGPRGRPVLNVIVDGSEIASDINVAKNAKHAIFIRNIGEGNMGWRLEYPPYINITKGTESIKKYKKNEALEGVLKSGEINEIHFEYNHLVVNTSIYPNNILIKASTDGLKVAGDLKGADCGHHKIILV